MDTKQQLEELMDRYLTGKMTTDEKTAFELQLSQDTQLREELSLHKQIIDSIKKKNLKEQLQRTEQKIHSRNRRQIFIRTISGIAAAACIFFAVLITNNNSSLYKSYGDSCYEEFYLPVTRGDNKVDSLLHAANQQISDKEYKIAFLTIDKAIEILQQETFDTSTEEGQYYQEMSEIKMDNAEWMKTIVYMKQGKKCKAKKWLKKIAESKSEYSNSAKEILQK
ncbi:hypothetical protein LJC68_04015 [Bacteroidales bacterium OttesenSCG-928-B11]|nr:hypothetical protein [Bacteroidales bacterium OttesenSCG-928-C03]MDL2312025.1 hypothetical protein [Bacteroidales bacterium OttesenSCG-928-B11]